MMAVAMGGAMKAALMVAEMTVAKAGAMMEAAMAAAQSPFLQAARWQD
jgi:hypothetical protein